MELSDLNGIRLNTARKDSFSTISHGVRTHILLIDEAHGRVAAQESAFRGFGVQPFRVSNAEQARLILAEQEFAAVVLDAQAPGSSSLEIVQWMRAHLRHRETPVLFLGTRNAPGLDFLSRIDIGPFDYVALPVPAEVLRSKIALLADLHRARRELRTTKAALEETRARLAVNEVALSERNAQLIAIFEHPTELVVLLEAELDGYGVVKDWIYRDANTNALKLIGLTREGVSGRRLSDLFAVSYEETASHCEQALRGRKRVRYDSHYQGKDYRVTVCPGGERLVVLSALDVTDRKQAAHAAHEGAAVD